MGNQMPEQSDKRESMIMQAEEVYDLIRAQKVIVIVRGVGMDVIVDIANAVYEGGAGLMEITCNTPGFGEMISLLSKETAGRMVIGAGTVISESLCEEALSAGAQYVIAPNVNPEVIKYAVRRDVAVLPGAATATEVLTAARHGAKMVKIFPAGVLGADYVRYLGGPIDDVEFVAVGGIRLDNVCDFMAAGCVGIGIGGEVTQKELVENADWATMSEIVKKYICRVKSGKDGKNES